MNIKAQVSFLLFTAMVTLIISCNPPQSKTEAVSGERVAIADPLPSWNEGASKKSIIDFVNNATKEGGSDFIPVADRIAVFDNDGTLWPEQPIPNQLIFAIDNLRALAPAHPEFQKDVVLNGVLQGDIEPLKEAGIPGLLKLINASHNNQTETAFSRAVINWADTAKDKKFGMLYKEVIYQPMVELLNYLRAHSFKTFIVSGGGADFMRPWCEEAYGIPPYQVIGSYGELQYDVVEGKPVITKVTGEPFIDDKAGKPLAIHRFIGKVPVFCAGNSDGDQAMMQYTSSSKYKSLCLIVHHTDSVREYKYDLKTLSGHLETALVEAKEKNWLVVDMKNDFNRIFSFEK
jgi:phosphoglycolate phosphatase-like HAD superfamily hydrolase